MSVSYIIWRVADAPARLLEVFPQAPLDHFIVEYSRCVQTPADSVPHPYKPDWRVFTLKEVSL